MDALAAELIEHLRSMDALYPESRDEAALNHPRCPDGWPQLFRCPAARIAAAEGWTKGGTWLDQHADVNRIAAEGNVDLVFLGDSITQSWGGEGRHVEGTGGEAWNEYFASRRAANFEICGDRTQHVLWRIENRNLDGIDPAFVVLLIGTNHLADDSPEDIAAGIELIVRRIEERLPQNEDHLKRHFAARFGRRSVVAKGPGGEFADFDGGQRTLGVLARPCVLFSERRRMVAGRVVCRRPIAPFG
jgi:hypothetical protein